MDSGIEPTNIIKGVVHLLLRYVNGNSCGDDGYLRGKSAYEPSGIKVTNAAHGRPQPQGSRVRRRSNGRSFRIFTGGAGGDRYTAVVHAPVVNHRPRRRRRPARPLRPPRAA
ncbi:hypothetical protein EVAR_22_1 [Eumeta japonica]|uniref:Uncharacterized protein n=1 Tax=Eumeta variegata TaxID=151549 RepID=A0A4C1SB83_EUMVA|nr:hypothetical protein EVAR_22_1 [Eumeta japonica]